jgi:ribokinase
MSNPRVLVVGSANLDLVAQVDRAPEAGETVIGGVFHQVHGGKGANQAVACARLGAETWFLGRVGADAFGDALLAGLESSGVHTDYVVRDPAQPSGVALIVVSAEGENRIVVCGGANAACAVEDLAALPDWAEFDVVLAQLEIPLPVVEAAFSGAAARGVLTVLDPAPACCLAPELLATVGVLTPNETEAKILLGKTLASELPTEMAAELLLQQGVQRVVLKLGARGAYAAERGGAERIFAPHVSPVDTTGAGDAFSAALGVSLARGMTLVEATQVACAAGSLATTVLGAQPSMPTWAEVERCLADCG